MDIAEQIGQFVRDGKIALPPYVSLAALAEIVYQSAAAAGTTDKVILTFRDYQDSLDGTAQEYTHEQVMTRSKAVAARLQQVAEPGDRVAIIAGNCPEYLFAFIGALYAGMIPVPLYDPQEPGHGDHLRAVIADARPVVVATARPFAASVRAFFAQVPSRERPRILAVDALPDSVAASLQPTQQNPQAIDSIAFLQYTSGSTRTPAGVELTHRAIITNVIQIFLSVQVSFPIRGVSWLPLHHDMGMIFALFTQILGIPFELTTPRAFLQRPDRWLQMLADGEDKEPVFTVIPNFALELATQRLSADSPYTFKNVGGILIGSEPVSAASVGMFLAKMEPLGLERTVVRPTYGMAEASLIITTPQDDNRPLFTSFDRAALAEGTALPTDGDDAVTMASNGQVVLAQALVIVDPETRQELPDGQVGEVWLQGDNLAAGYWDRPEETNQSFGQVLAGRLATGSHAEGWADENWLATGDLGAIVDGQFYITGRLKDMAIIAGRNHYPQDIEATAQEATDYVRPDSVAAFAIPGDDVEKLVILAERADTATVSEDNDAAAVNAIRQAVASMHGVTPSDIRMMNPMAIARSSAGKIARKVNQKQYLENQK